MSKWTYSYSVTITTYANNATGMYTENTRSVWRVIYVLLWHWWKT
jgi:hypothetical protein